MRLKLEYFGHNDHHYIWEPENAIFTGKHGGGRVMMWFCWQHHVVRAARCASVRSGVRTRSARAPSALVDDVTLRQNHSDKLRCAPFLTLPNTMVKFIWMLINGSSYFLVLLFYTWTISFLHVWFASVEFFCICFICSHVVYLLFVQ